MNDAERDLIAGLFQRIRSVETARRDPEAEAFISDEVARQPHAPYAMAQTLVVQDQALKAAQARVEELERQLADACEGADRPGPFGGGFASPQAPSRPAASQPSASPWGPRAQETMARAEAARSGGPWRQGDGEMSPPFGAPDTRYGQPGGFGQQPGYGAPQPRPEEPSRGGGFLSGALQTAAGVAAGALIFQGAKSIFGGGEEKAQGAGEAAGQTAGSAGDAGGSGASEIGNWYDGLFGGGDQSASARQDDDDDADDDSWL